MNAGKVAKAMWILIDVFDNPSAFYLNTSLTNVYDQYPVLIKEHSV